MIPVVCDVKELDDQNAIVEKVYEEVMAKFGMKKIPHMYRHHDRDPARGPRRRQDRRDRRVLLASAPTTSPRWASASAATISAASCRITSKRRSCPATRSRRIDQDGIGELIEIGIERGRQTKPKLKIGICGEHGGDPASIEFCHRVGMNYVSCSPFRVPIARLAAAQAAVAEAKRLAAKPQKAAAKAKPAKAKAAKPKAKAKAAKPAKASKKAKKARK